MTDIKRAEHMTAEQLNAEIRAGGRVVVHRCAISLVFVTLFLASGPKFVPAGRRDWGALGYSLVTLVLGWWGFPWGPIRTLQALFHNATGRRNLTTQTV